MPTGFTRRRFLASLAAAVPIAVVVRRAHAAALAHLQTDPRVLDALGETVLPSELGGAGLAREIAAFRDWGAGYREGAELVHGYGTSRLRSTGPTPLTRWMRQLDELDAAARAKHQHAFREVSIAQRAELVRAALANDRLDRMPAVGDARHVAVALLAHFYESTEASDLCYHARIGKSTCRPLASSTRVPMPMYTVRER